MKLKNTLFALFLFMLASASFAQVKSVSGRVISEKLEPIEGVQVVNSRTRVSATTDQRGIFTIRAVPGDPLIFSYPSCISSRRVTSKSQKPVNVVLLNEDSEGFDSRLMEKKYKKLARLAEQKGSWNYSLEN